MLLILIADSIQIYYSLISKISSYLLYKYF